MSTAQKGEPYDYTDPDLTYEDVETCYPNLWATIEQNFDLSDGVLYRIAQVVLGTCPSCHNASLGCQCANDE